MTEPPAVATSEEQFAPVAADVELCYQTFGDPADEAMLLVMGLGGPMTWWDPELCAMLAREGFFVIRYDNRDTGRSSRMHGSGPVTRAAMLRAFLNAGGRAPYSLVDMAGDAYGLLDHLGVERAHVVGVSMGGMIVQEMVLAQPQRVLSLTSFMSTTGRRTVGWQDPRLLPLLVARRGNRETYIDSSALTWRLIGSPGYPTSKEQVQAHAAQTWERGVTRAGVARQTVAVLAAPDRTRRLREVDVPALVVHGLADKMVHVSGGRATARALRGSELLLVPGMGHDTPPELYPTFTEAITRTARRAGGGRCGSGRAGLPGQADSAASTRSTSSRSASSR